MIRIAVLTISDRCSKGETIDHSGPALVEFAKKLGWQVVSQKIVPDELDIIRDTLLEWTASLVVEIILTTGGTGFAPRDVTPEATLAVIEKNAPGLVEMMRAESVRITPHGMLSRAVAGIRNRTLIINLPGSPKGAVENLNIVKVVLPHAVELITETAGSEAGHQI